jgi:hypothetical protein
VVRRVVLVVFKLKAQVARLLLEAEHRVAVAVAAWSESQLQWLMDGCGRKQRPRVRGAAGAPSGTGVMAECVRREGGLMLRVWARLPRGPRAQAL